MDDKLDRIEKGLKELTSFVGDHFGIVYKKFDDMDKKFDDLWGDFRQLQSSVDAYAHKADTYFMEMAAIGNKVDRLEKWINQLAEKVGIKLS